MAQSDYNEMLQYLERLSGIKIERDKNGLVNTTKFLEDYKNKYTVAYKDLFGNNSPNQVIDMFFKEYIK